jgi:hypothetical protein
VHFPFLYILACVWLCDQDLHPSRALLSDAFATLFVTPAGALNGVRKHTFSGACGTALIKCAPIRHEDFKQHNALRP